MATNRFYNAGSAGQLTSSLPQIFDPNQVASDGNSTGVWRAYQTTDLTNITISGVVVEVGSVAVTGVPTVILSGAPTVTPIFTGAPSITIANNPNVGFVIGSVVGLSGSPNVTNNGGFVGITGTHPVSLTGSNNTAFASVSTAAPSGSMSSIITGMGLAANSNRKKFYAQVIGSGAPLWISYNGLGASSGNFNVLLKASSADPGTDGGTISDADFKGAVFISGGNACRFVLWEGV